MSKMYVGEVYEVDPSSIKFDEMMSTFNRTQTDKEYMATKLSIKEIGQQHPIAINNKTGLCEDGRHRVRACKELGINVKCIGVNNDIDASKRLELYNLELMSGRDISDAQRAVQAHKYMLMSGVKQKIAAARFKVTSADIGYVTTIYGLGKKEVLDELIEHKKWTSPDGAYKSSSLRGIKEYLVAEDEEGKLEEVLDTPTVDYNDLVLTAAGRLEFWKYWKICNLSNCENREVKRMLVDFMNYKYRLKEEEK